MAPSEVTVDAKSPMPKGYGFLPKGNPFRTGRCRQLTLSAGRTLYAVTEKRKPVGLRAPKSIISEVFKLDSESREERKAAVLKRDQAAQKTLKDEILRQFPKIPDKDAISVTNHTLIKRSGRVGRTELLTLKAKARLAVMAYIRHKHTEYDKLLRVDQMPRQKARDQVQAEIMRILRDWQGGKPMDQRDRSRRKVDNKKISSTSPSKTKSPQQRKEQHLPTYQGKGQLPKRKSSERKERAQNENQRAPPKKGHRRTPRGAPKLDTSRNAHQRAQYQTARPLTRASAAARGQASPFKSLEILLNDEDSPILISSDDSDNEMDTANDSSSDEIELTELDDYSDAFIIHDSDDGSEDEFVLP